MTHLAPSRLLRALAASALLAAPAALADWTPLGPDGGEVVALAVDPGDDEVVYAATAGAIFHSSDGGDSWTAGGSEVSLGAVRSMVVGGGAVFASTSYRGAWRSTDGGRTWAAINSGLGDPANRPFLEQMAWDPGRGGRLWVASSQGLFLSTDRGATWTHRSESLGSVSLAWVDVDTRTGQLYAATYSKLLTSHDDGATWEDTTCNHCTRALVDPERPGTAYAFANSLLRTSDDGATWEKVRSPRNVWGFRPLATRAGRLYAAARLPSNDGLDREHIYWSDDAGGTWVAAAQQPQDVAQAVLAAGEEAAYVGSYYTNGAGGVSRSRDRGETWEPASHGLSSRWIEHLTVDPRQPGVLWAKAANHLFVSEDDGASWWVSLAQPRSGTYGAGSLLVDPNLTGRVFLADFYLYRSDDGGRKWTYVRRPGLGVYSVVADPRTPGGVWAGGYDGLYQSKNGKAWTRVKVTAPGELLGVEAIAVDPLDPATVWVSGYVSTRTGVGNGPRLFRSGDGGKSWQRRDDGLPGDYAGTVVVDPIVAGTVLATRGAGLFRSRDDGSTWEELHPPLPAGVGDHAWNVLAAPDGPATAWYAWLDGPSTATILRSSDAGSSWAPVAPGDPVPAPVRSLAVDPHDASRLLVGTTARGVFAR